MGGGLIDAFESSLPLLSLIGLILDAGGAILVLGPEIPIISKVATSIERREMEKLLEELKQEQHLKGDIEAFNRLFQEMWSAPTGDLRVEEVVLEDDRVIMGRQGLEDGERTGKQLEEFENWIQNYRGIDREYYLAGGGLLLVGFLFQIIARSASINIIFGVVSLVVTIFVCGYLLYRARRYVWWLPT